jgi:Tol biopolymer transport system component
MPRRFYLYLATLLLLVSVGLSSEVIAGKPIKVAGGEENFYMNPRWSPDGSKIAFSGSNYRGLYVLDLSAGLVEQISDDDAAGFGFSWSVDGRSLVARVARYEAKKRLNAVKLFDLSDGKERLLSEFQPRMTDLPRWSPNNASVYLYADKQLKSFPTGRLSKPTYSWPQYYSARNNIYISDARSGEFKRFQPIPGGDYINLTLSPNGQYLAFEVMGGHMYVMSVDGEELVDLGVGYRPQWAPDNMHLVYMLSKDDGHDYTSSEIYIIRRDGTNRRQVTDTPERLEMNPHWSPDGKQIVYDDLASGSIFIEDVEL